MNWQEIDFQKYIEMVIPFGIKVAMAILIFVIGLSIVKLVSSMLRRAMNARSVEPTIATFVGRILHYLMLAFVVIAALGQLGVQTASVIAILGAAGLAVGLALQGTLSNFAAGVMLILLRPLRVGDFVEVSNTSGTVSEVSIFATRLLTGDYKTVVVPNSAVMGNTITNYSAQERRRIDLVVGVGYGSNLQQVKQELQIIADAEQRLLREYDVVIGVNELADSSVNLVFRSWVKTSDYWPVKWALTEKVKTRFDELGIEIPFPQLDIHNKSQQQAA
ncbi:MAG: mechanosensitive ion channel [Gammaproteobacteria bacterium]|nr:mechanosensitive ion channel [Gammaproteobacteria bacterium]MBT8150468.1 mechanosensitive ion channel [Gammaproteobacteria bacterium]NND39733.1 mechanosensitive ion channel [Pseudomonadales bacterium]NNM11973.1 mechanosensitive ion channel [Pseudomonadales bacterium]